MKTMQMASCSLINEHLMFVIEARIMELLSSPVQTVLEFPPFFNKFHRDCIHKVAKSNGLYSVTQQRNGVKYAKVYKEYDSFVRLAPSFRLTDLSQKIIFHYLKNHKILYGDCLDKLRAKYLDDGKPKIPVYRFCAGTISDDALSPPPKSQNKFAENTRLTKPLSQYKADIIETIRKSQVTILCSDSLHGRISEVPQFLLEECHKNNESCRIICSLAHKNSAIYYSEIVSAERGERLGLTVGYQIHLESMSSMSTNLLYTTSNFFLRCLMGNNKQETFSAITHVIVDDIDEQEPFSYLLLHEICQALPCHLNLKVILMCGQKQVEKLMRCFKEAALLKMMFTLPEKTIYHMEEILYLTSCNIDSKSDVHSIDARLNLKDVRLNSVLVDQVLSKCMESGNEEDFELFMKLLKDRNVDINAQHSQTKVTVGIAAARHDQINYLMMFVSLGGDLSCTDVFNKSALDWALESQNEICLEFLQDKFISPMSWDNPAFSQRAQNKKKCLKSIWTENSRVMVLNVIQYIHFNGGPGTILVLLPTFSDLAKQDFLIKQLVATGKIQNNIKVYLHHLNTQLSDYRLMSQTNELNTRNIILSTQLPMSLLAIENIKFVIDGGLTSKATNCSLQLVEERSLCWISQSCAIERTFLLSATPQTYCFRLYSKRQFDSFQAQTENLSERSIVKNVSLYAKLLAPETSVREYMCRSGQEFSPEAIDSAINQLKEIEALDETESITALGIRLVDIPIDPNLAKVLLFGIVLQCLDPVLTIVSTLSRHNPCVFLEDIMNMDKPESQIDDIQPEEGSDHLILLRLYQNWIERGGCNEILLTENNYVLNAELEIVSNIRSQLIGILRAAGMIQSSGTMNIHFINQHANNWSMVKAAFTAGMYANVCRIERMNNKLILKKSIKGVFHQQSVLAHHDIHKCQTDWVLYQGIQMTQNEEPLIVCNTLITPTTLTLFAGNSYLGENDIIHLSEIESDSESEDFNAYIKQKSVRLNIDEWLSFILYEEDAYLLMEIRQKLFSLLNDILRVPEDIEKFRKTKHLLHDKFRVIDSIAILLQNEEEEYKLPQPKRIGDRPNAFSSKFTKFQDKIATLKNNMMNLHSNTTVPSPHGESDSTAKSFFVVKVSSKNHARQYLQRIPLNSNLPTWKEIIQRYRQFPTVNIIIFLMVDENDYFCGTAQLCSDGELFFLNEVASRDIAVNELKALYFTNGEYFPGCFDGQELSFNVGKRLFDLFL